MKTKKLISDNDFQLIKGSLLLLRSKSTKNPEGKIGISSDINTDIAIEILNSYLLKTYSDFERTRKGVIFKAIKRWLNYKVNINSDRLIHSSFNKALSLEFQAIENQKESQYSVLMFLNIDEKSIAGFNKIKIFGESIVFIPWSEVFKMDVSKLWYEINFFDRENPIIISDISKGNYYPNTSDFTPVLATINIFSPDAAIDIANKSIDFIRSILNVHLLFGQYIHFRSNPSPLSEILPSPIYIIFNSFGKREQQMYYGIGEFLYRKKEIDSKNIGSIINLLRKFTIPIKENSSWHFIYEILNQYQNALDFANIDHAFLGMWQVLENCIGFGERIKDNKVIQTRITSLLKLDLFTAQFLEILRKQRNDFVHNGKYLNENEKYFYILKIITDSVIKECIFLARIFKTKNEMKEYISLLSLGDIDLKRKKSVIEKIVKSRKQVLNMKI